MNFLAIMIAALVLAGCAEESKQGSTHTIEALRGQWVVINYWAKWCKPCIREIPELNRLDRDYAEISVLGVNYDDATGEDLATQIHQLDIEFPVLPQDPAAGLGAPRPVVLPTTLILNPAGQLTQTLLGPQTLDSLLQAIKKPANGPVWRKSLKGDLGPE